MPTIRAPLTPRPYCLQFWAPYTAAWKSDGMTYTTLGEALARVGDGMAYRIMDGNGDIVASRVY